MYAIRSYYEDLVAFDQDLQGRVAALGVGILDVGAAVGHGVAVLLFA